VAFFGGEIPVRTKQHRCYVTVKRAKREPRSSQQRLILVEFSQGCILAFRKFSSSLDTQRLHCAQIGMKQSLALAATLLMTSTSAFAPPHRRRHVPVRAAMAPADAATDELLDSWLLDDLGSCAVADFDDDDAFELCSVDAPSKGCVDVYNIVEEAPRLRIQVRRRKEPIGRLAYL